MYANKTKGFTLIELLIVIGIIAVLAVVVLLTLNPAELLRQARDSNRTSDLSTVKGALAFFLADVATSTTSGSGVGALGNPQLCYVTIPTGASFTSDTAGGCGGRFSTANLAAAATTTFAAAVARNVNGTGWIPVDMGAISAGAPISALPIDPKNSSPTPGTLLSNYFYAYRASSTVYELNAKMESIKFSNGGTADVEKTDGGNNDNLFEVGTDPSLDL